MKKALDGNEAMAYGVKLSRPKVVAAYPITPQTQIVEKIADFILEKELDAKYIEAESEHSVLSLVVGAAITGVRAFTATAGAGLALMHEIVGVAAGNRLPLVMGIANRSLPSPWSLQTDHSDSMAERDMGWIQLYAANSQESLDLTICAYTIAENTRLPVMVCHDGFYVSHAVSVVDIPDQELVDTFVPPHKPNEIRLDVDHPMTMNQLTSAETFTEIKYQQKVAMDRARSVTRDVGQSFGEVFGREYAPVQAINCENADLVIVTLGSSSGAAIEAARQMTTSSYQVGVLKITCFRPFPADLICQYLNNVKAVAVVDRTWGLGAEGTVCQETKAALYNLPQRPAVFGYIGGLGGRDLRLDTMKKVVELSKTRLASGQIVTDPEWIDVKTNEIEELV